MTIRYIFFFLFIAVMPVHAQNISINVLSKMDKPYDFKTSTLITRLLETQKDKIANGILNEFEARCITVNIIDTLGAENAERFVSITEKVHQKFELSIQDEKFMNEVYERYLPYISLVTQQCTIESKRKAQVTP